MEAQIGQITKIILEDQERSFPTIEEAIKEDVDAKEFIELVEKEKSTSPEPKEMIKEAEKTTQKMTPWGDMHEELKIREVTHMSKVEEYIIKLNKETEAAIVTQKEEIVKKNNDHE